MTAVVRVVLAVVEFAETHPALLGTLCDAIHALVKAHTPKDPTGDENWGA